MDAADLADAAAFDAAYWAQTFFADATRGPALDAIRTALRPGGVLVMQELHPPVAPAEATLETLQDALLYRRWGISLGHSAEQLGAEAERHGFTSVRIAETPLGRLVVANKPS
jgi:hypothetical protein